MYKLQPLLLERWNGYFQQSFNEMQQIRKRGTLAVIAWSLISGFGTALPYVYVVSGVLRGIYTLGDLALYAGLIFEVRRSLMFVIASMARLYDIALGTSPIFQLLELKSQLQMLHLEGGKNTNSTKPNLSNNEIWQRIAIARALMRRSQAELLIFDEPTAALDPKTEHEVYDIFRAIAKQKITVIVSHRLALAKMADRIVVMENAKILEIGTHNQLMALGGQYSLMFNRQASSYV